MHQRALVVIGALAAVEAAYFALLRDSLGFPDGHLTELDRWRQVTCPIFVVLLVLAAVATLYAAVRRHRSRAVPVVASVVVPACLVIDWVGRASQEHGGGG